MAMFEMGRVKIGDVEGHGYAFSRETVFGKQYQGIFFPDDHQELEELTGEEEVIFQGPVYHRRRDRSARRSKEELTVAIVNSTSTPLGERAEFKDVDSL